MRLSIINGWTGKRRTALVEINYHTDKIERGYWADNQTELDEDEILILEETFSNDIQESSKEWADDCRAEEEWERDREK